MRESPARCGKLGRSVIDTSFPAMVTGDGY